jgi:hypothetical protein
MSPFPTAGHLLSWAGFVPRLDESAGKTPFWSIRGTYLAGSLDLALDAADTIQGRDCV